MAFAERLGRLARNDISRHVGGSALVFLCRLSGAALTFLTQVLLARWMGATELGTYVLAFSWCVMLAMIAGLGYPSAGVRFLPQALELGDRHLARGFIRRSGLIVAWVSLGLSAGAATLVLTVDGLVPAGRAGLFALAALSIPALAQIRLFRGIAQGFSWFPLAFVPGDFLRPLLFCLSVVLYWSATRQLDAQIVMALQMSALFLLAVGTGSMLRRRLRRALAGARAAYERRLWDRTSLPLLVVSLFTAYFPEFTVIALGMLLRPDELAIYHASNRTALLIAFALTAVASITAPAAARLHASGDRQGLQRTITHTTTIQFLAALVVVGVFAAFGTRILSLFGAEFVTGYPVLVILALAQLLRATLGPVVLVLTATGHQNQCLPVFALALLLSVVSIATLVPPFGVTGAALASVIVTAFWGIWLHRLVIRLVGIRPSIFSALRHR